MLKIMRKNKQWLFVAFMGILAVAWLVPSMGQSSPGDQSKEKVGMIGDHKLTLGEINIAEAEFETLKSQFRDLLPLEALVGLQVENGYHWLLLCREAEQAGLIGGATDGAEWIPALARAMAPAQAEALRQQNMMQAYQMVLSNPQAKEIVEKNPNMIMPILTQMVEGRLKTVLEQARTIGNQSLSDARNLGGAFHDDPFDKIIAKVRGVRRLTNSFYGAARTSDKRLASIAVEKLDQAVVDFLLIPADRIKREIPEPTPEQLQAQFDKYKTVQPGTGDLGIGYVQPDGIKLEYMKIDRAAIQAVLKADEVEVNKRWRSNREKYKGEFAEERPKIEQEMQAELVKSAMTEAVRIARAEINRAIKRLPDDGAYKTIPADWETNRIKLEDIARTVQATIKNTQNFDIPVPLVTLKTGSWLSPKDVNALEGISGAGTQIGVKRETFVQLMGHLKEASGRNDYALQVGIPYPTDKALEGADGSMYFFTVTAYKKSAPAESLEEVKSQVIDDFKLIGAFEKLKADQQKYLDQATAEGLEGVARSFAKPALDPKTGAGAESELTIRHLVQVDEAGIIVNGQRDRSMAGEKAYLDQIRTIVKTIDPKAPPAIGDGAKGEAVKNRFVAYPMPRARGLVISFIVANRPVTQEQMRAVGQGGEERTLVLQEFKPDDGKTKIDDPFQFPTMKQRMRFVLTKELKVEEKPVAPATTPKSEAGVTGEPIGGTSNTGVVPTK